MHFAESGELYNDRGIKGKKNRRKNKQSSVDNFTQNLSSEYFNNGIFNLPVRVHKFIPEASCDVTITFSNSGRKITGRFTKSGKTHKINGNTDLSEWYYKYVSESKKVQIQIINPSHFNLSIPY